MQSVNLVTYSDLNEDQRRVHKEIGEFISSHRPVHSLIGAGGTGKTTVLRQVLRSSFLPLCVSAPTHKAKNVIANVTGIKDCHTIAELLGLGLNVDISEFDPHKPEFAMLNRQKMLDYKLVVIDEASMVNAELFKALVEVAIENNIKILFVGDIYQLPPVGEDEDSLALSNEEFEQSELTTIVRQGVNNPLSYMLAALRYEQYIDIHKAHNIKMMQEVCDIAAIFKKVDTDELIRQKNNPFSWMVNNYPEHIINGKGFKILEDRKLLIKKAVAGTAKGGKVLAFYNDTVNAYNSDIRSALDKHSFKFSPGDEFMCNRTARNGKDVLISNSAEYSIINIYPGTSKEGVKIEIWDIEGPNGEEVTIQVVNPNDSNFFRQVYAEKLNARKWPQFYTFKDQHLMTAAVAADLNDKKIKPDISFNYAITIHKSQGSTYKYSYVDSSDLHIVAKKERIFMLKLLYVAWSRASDAVLMLK
jgi:AAA domain/UvrD-like helicase C-terminal domain